MSYCQKCGFEVGPSDRFCSRCGEPVASASGSAAPGDAAVPDRGQASPQGDVRAASPACRQGSPLGRAWKDFLRSPQKPSIIAKLTLLQLVPVLGRVAKNGYALDWACDLMNGTHMPMDRKIVRHGVLDKGLYALGSSAVMALVVAFVAFILATGFGALDLDAVYVLLLVVFLVVAGPLASIMLLRAAYHERIREGLRPRRAWDMLARPGKTAQAFAAYWIPAIATAVLGALAWILVLVTFVGFLTYTVSLYPGFGGMLGGYYGMLAGTFVVMRALGLLLAYIPVIMAACLVLDVVGTIATIVAYRALAYWMRDLAAEDAPELGPCSTEGAPASKTTERAGTAEGRGDGAARTPIMGEE